MWNAALFSVCDLSPVSIDLGVTLQVRYFYPVMLGYQRTAPISSTRGIAQLFRSSRSSGSRVSETRQCGSAWWGHLNLRASVSLSTTLGLEAVVNPTCLTLKSGGTTTATLVVSATRLVVPSVYSVTVSVEFQVSPSGWSSGSSTVVSVHVIQGEPPVFGRG